MAKRPEQPFACDRCRTQPKKNFHIFSSTGTWLISYPEGSTIHLHFGRSTWSGQESTAQGEWVYHYFVDVFKRTKKDRWFILVDMARLDDSTFPSEEAKGFYKKALQLPQVNRVVFYGASTSLTFLINMILRFSNSDAKGAIVRRADDAEELYRQWHSVTVP